MKSLKELGQSLQTHTQNLVNRYERRSALGAVANWNEAAELREFGCYVDPHAETYKPLEYVEQEKAERQRVRAANAIWRAVDRYDAREQRQRARAVKYATPLAVPSRSHQPKPSDAESQPTTGPADSAINVRPARSIQQDFDDPLAIGDAMTFEVPADWAAPTNLPSSEISPVNQTAVPEMGLTASDDLFDQSPSNDEPIDYYVIGDQTTLDRASSIKRNALDRLNSVQAGSVVTVLGSAGLLFSGLITTCSAYEITNLLSQIIQK
jgi:hypothetical protein